MAVFKSYELCFEFKFLNFVKKIYYVGLIASFVGGLVVGVAFYFGIILGVSNPLLSKSSSKLPIILVGAIGGLLGSLIDSLLGATCRYSDREEVFKIIRSHFIKVNLPLKYFFFETVNK